MKGPGSVLRSPSWVAKSLVETTRRPRALVKSKYDGKDIDPDKTVIVCKSFL